MKKTILGISFLMLAAFAGQASAQCANDKCPDQTLCKKEQCDKNKCDKKDCEKNGCDVKACDTKSECAATECDAKKGPYCKMPPRGARMENLKEGQCKENCPFETLNLSDDQKVQVKDLQNALKESRKEMREAAKASGQRPNPADMKKAEMQLRSKYLSDLKNILSPEQYTEFLQNYYVNSTLAMGPQRGNMERRDIQPRRFDNVKLDKAKKLDAKDAKKEKPVKKEKKEKK